MQPEVIILPYVLGGHESVADKLIEELTADRWTSFRVAVAFAKSNGNDGALLDALYAFAHAGHRLEFTFGADRFSGDTPGSEVDAIRTLVQRLDGEPGAKLFLYHEQDRTFHPKVFLLANEVKNRALVFVGSSNWTGGGLFTNIEANLALPLDLTAAAQRDCYQRVNECFERYWQESSAPSTVPGCGFAKRITRTNFETFAPLLCPRDDKALGTVPGVKGKAATPVDPNLRAAEALFDGKRFKCSFPKPVKVKVPKGHTSRTPSGRPVVGPIGGASWTLVWRSDELSDRDLNIPRRKGTHTTGSMTLRKGAWDNIDQRHYFRDDVFDRLTWKPDAKRPHLSSANASFELVVQGVSRGTFVLTVRHNSDTTTAAYKERNAMTHLRWDQAKAIVATKDLLGSTLELYRSQPAKGVPLYRISIS